MAKIEFDVKNPVSTLEITEKPYTPTGGSGILYSIEKASNMFKNHTSVLLMKENVELIKLYAYDFNRTYLKLLHSCLKNRRQERRLITGLIPD